MNVKATFAFFTIVALCALAGCKPGTPSVQGPGEAEFRAANKQIILYRDQASFGNNREAEALAALFEQTVAKLRQAGIEEGRKRGFSLSKGRMLVYCQLTTERCAFLVHVPELRKFTGDAKELMATFAWTAAQAALKAKGLKREHLAVGVKGAMLYDTIMLGSSVEGDADLGKAIREHGSDPAMLHPFFAPASAVTPAHK